MISIFFLIPFFAFAESLSYKILNLNNKLLSFFIVIILVLGFNFTFWGVIGLIRIVFEKNKKLKQKKKKTVIKNKIRQKDVAVLVPAHNEELVISDTIKSLLKLINPENIFIISDGSTDKTAEISRSDNVNVLESNPGKGKAGALEFGIKHFDIINKFKAVLLVDADTRLKFDYLKKALPLFNDKDIVAVAGYASTIWNPENLSLTQILFISHRDRVYFLTQRFIKFGQTWKYTNVTHIVPGFASIYKTSILNKININPKGLVIEDFNMTFEVHHKKLGKIAHHPNIVAYTQDPDNIQDYYKQIKRWHLGFWQTVRLHGFWPGRFWLAMVPTLFEVIIGSVVFLLLPIFVIMSAFSPLLGLEISNLNGFLIAIILGTLFADYLLTIVVTIFQKRKEYLFFGLFFPFIRLIDGFAFLSAIPRAFFIKSNGRWISPARRANKE